MELERLMRLAAALSDAGGGALTPALIEQVAEDHGVPRSHAWAATIAVPDATFAAEHPVTFIVCVGGCQAWGSLERIEQLLDLRARRLADGRPGFDLRVRPCLDLCQRAPAAIASTPHGTLVLPGVTPEQVAEAVDEACAP